MQGWRLRRILLLSAGVALCAVHGDSEDPWLVVQPGDRESFINRSIVEDLPGRRVAALGESSLMEPDVEDLQTCDVAPTTVVSMVDSRMLLRGTCGAAAIVGGGQVVALMTGERALAIYSLRRGAFVYKNDSIGHRIKYLDSCTNGDLILAYAEGPSFTQDEWAVPFDADKDLQISVISATNFQRKATFLRQNEQVSVWFDNNCRKVISVGKFSNTIWEWQLHPDGSAVSQNATLYAVPAELIPPSAGDEYSTGFKVVDINRKTRDEVAFVFNAHAYSDGPQPLYIWRWASQDSISQITMSCGFAISIVFSPARDEILVGYGLWSTCAFVGPDGRAGYGWLELLQRNSNVTERFTNYGETATDIEFFPDGNWVITNMGDPSMALRIWELRTRKMRLIKEFGRNAICNTRFFPDGLRLLTTSQANSLTWLPASGYEIWAMRPQIQLHGIEVGSNQMKALVSANSPVYVATCIAKGPDVNGSGIRSRFSYLAQDASLTRISLENLMPNTPYNISCYGYFVVPTGSFDPDVINGKITTVERMVKCHVKFERTLDFSVVSASANFSANRVRRPDGLLQTPPRCCGLSWYAQEDTCQRCGYPAKTTASDCAQSVEECVCSDGFAWKQVGNVSNCEKCPASLNCSGQNWTAAEAPAMLGYARLAEGDQVARKCFPRVAGSPLRCQGNKSFSEQCIPSTTGPLCELCAPGSRRMARSSCTPCIGFDTGYSIGAASVIVAFLLFLRLLKTVLTRVHQRLQLRASGGRPFWLLVWTHWMQQVPILLTFCQLAGCVLTNTGTKTSIGYVLSAFNELQVTAQGIRDTLRLDCHLGAELAGIGSLVARASLLPIVLIILALISLIPQKTEQAVRYALLAVALLFVGGVSSASTLTLNSCQSVDGEGLPLGDAAYLRAMPSQKCSSWIATALWVWGLLCLLFHGIVVPWGTVSLLQRRKRATRPALEKRSAYVEIGWQGREVVIRCLAQDWIKPGEDDWVGTTDADLRVLASAYVAAFHQECECTAAILVTKEGTGALEVRLETVDATYAGRAIELGASLALALREQVTLAVISKKDPVLKGACALFFKYSGSRAVATEAFTKAIIVLMGAVATKNPVAAGGLSALVGSALLALQPYSSTAMSYVASASYFSIAGMLFLTSQTPTEGELESTAGGFLSTSGINLLEHFVAVVAAFPFLVALTLLRAPDNVYGLALRLHGKMCVLNSRQLDAPGVSLDVHLVNTASSEEQVPHRVISHGLGTLAFAMARLLRLRRAKLQRKQGAGTLSALAEESLEEGGPAPDAMAIGKQQMTDVFGLAVDSMSSTKSLESTRSETVDKMASRIPLGVMNNALTIDSIKEILESPPQPPPPLFGHAWMQKGTCNLLHKRRAISIEAGKLSWGKPVIGLDATRFREVECIDFTEVPASLFVTTSVRLRIIYHPRPGLTRGIKILISNSDRTPQEWIRTLLAHMLHGQRVRNACGSPQSLLGCLQERKVLELAHRGISLMHLLEFYELLGSHVMKHFDPERSTTNDVVRQAVIPLSASSHSSYATLVSAGAPVRPRRMVTHNWGNNFSCLVAAIVADAMGVPVYKPILPMLQPSRIQELKAHLVAMGRSHYTYWVCAFCVNQHMGICGGFGPLDDGVGHRLDSTGVPMQRCECGLPKRENGDLCEMNKFDAMMGWLGRSDCDFSQVVALDPCYALFSRAWCQAELIEANRLRLVQSLKYHSEELLKMNMHMLKVLDVEQCEASRKEDKDEILRKIDDKEAFNRQLRELVLDKQSGLITTWERDAAVTAEGLALSLGAVGVGLFDM